MYNLQGDARRKAAAAGGAGEGGEGALQGTKRSCPGKTAHGALAAAKAGAASVPAATVAVDPLVSESIRRMGPREIDAAIERAKAKKARSKIIDVGLDGEGGAAVVGGAAMPEAMVAATMTAPAVAAVAAIAAGTEPAIATGTNPVTARGAATATATATPAPAGEHRPPGDQSENRTTKMKRFRINARDRLPPGWKVSRHKPDKSVGW